VYVFNAATQEFTLVDAGVTSQIWQDNKSPDRSYLAVEGATGLLLTQKLDSTMNHVFHDGEWALIWNLFVSENGKTKGFSLSLKFETNAEYMQFKRAFSTAHIQATLHQSLSTMKLSDDDVDYLMDQVTEKKTNMLNPNTSNLSDDDESDKEAVSDEEDNQIDELGAGTLASDDEDEEPEDHTAANSLLTTTRDRTYVVRGGKIGVFGYSPKGHVRFDTMLTSLKFNRQGLRPDKVMMYNGDRSMIIRDKSDASKLYELDLGSEKIVNEWKLGDDDQKIQLRDMTPATKSLDCRAPNDSTFMGITNKSVFQVDPRLNSGIVTDWKDGAYTYSTNVDLQSVATTANGEMAVASGKGELRLYNKIGKRATTTLHGTGEPIRHLDVSSSGRYVLATCTSCVLLFDVGVEDKTAFSKRMPANSRPEAIRLYLKPTHVAQMGGKRVCFTSAYFNISPSGESTIVTSTGPYVVTWSISDILERRRTDKYTIKRYSDDVVADQFRFGDDKQIVLALPHDVKSVSKSTLRNPDRNL
jgi:hypothetical protein